MGVHHLVTGLNGAGKTLYTVATKLRDAVGAEFEYRGETRKRRIVQGGINGLLIEHELMHVPKLEIDPETFVDEWKGHIREPGSPPVADVPCEIFNWWLWCEPGDLIVVDECQRVMRPMPSGRRVPMYISKLETARHYGVEFIYLTQHPQLLHQNVRKLVGPHEDVRRIFGSGRVMIYQWDRVSDPDRIAKATSRIWKHDKSAFRLYRSAELHHKFGQRLPLAVWGVVFGLIALLASLWFLRGRLVHRFGDKPVAAQSSQATAARPGGSVGGGVAPGASVSGVASPGGGAQQDAQGGKPGGQVDYRWPVYQAEAFKVNREPLDGRAVQWEGGYQDGSTSVAFFGLFVEGERVATLTLHELNAMGYSWRSWGPCVGALRFGDQERLVTCGKRYEVPKQDAPGAEALASAGSTSTAGPVAAAGGAR